MKRILLLLFICAGIYSCSGWKHNKNFNYYELACNEFDNKLKDAKSSYILIDVRTPKEYKKSHMDGALNISYFGGGFSEKTDSLNNNHTVFMYCQTQHRSPLAARILKKKGFKTIYDLKGGFMRWENQRMPVIKEKD